MNMRSIQMRLTVWYTALIIAAAAGFGAYSYFGLEQRLYDEMRGTLAHRIEHLRADVLPDIATIAPEALARKIEDIYSPEANDRFIRISRTDGTLLYMSGKPREGTFDPAHVPLPRDYTSKVSERLKTLRSREHLLLIGYVTPIDGGDYIIEMGASVAPVEIALHKLGVTLLIGLPVVVLIAVAGGSLLVRRALRPVETMRATAEQISFGKLRRRLPVGRSGDAIEQLAKTLNRMLDRLDLAYQQASRFSADASHELRTPLAIVRSEIEAMQHEQSLSPVLRDRVGSVLEEIERLSNIVESLFSLARLDAGEAKISNDTVDLAELARSTLEQMQLLADEKNLSVSVKAPEPVLIMGDATRLKQVIVNLLDNAVKYTMPGGSIALSVAASGTKAVLSVRDNGIGIAPDALPHVFERFYRADKVRSRATEGAGLGLSIVYAICQAHGGTVEAASEENHGATLTVALPLVRARAA